MTTKEQREALEKTLTGTLSRTVDFLKFAETKNAALLTFASAWLLALANVLASDAGGKPIPNGNHRHAPWSAVMCSVAKRSIATLAWAQRSDAATLRGITTQSSRYPSPSPS
jgi:hypothetical protein